MIRRDREFYTHEDAVTFNEGLEDLLTEHGITFEHDSPLERMSLRVLEVFERHRRTIEDQNLADARECFVDAMGLSDLTRKILRVKAHKHFELLVPHLALLNKGEFAQNHPLEFGTDVANKVFELLVACCCMTFIDSIELDNPERSKGDNPDLIVNYDGRKLGIACKALLSQNPKALYDNVEKAVKQIEDSPAETGLVIVSLKNVADHTTFWMISEPSTAEDTPQEPEFYAFADPDVAMQRIMEEIQATSQRYLEHASPELWLSLFQGKKACPCIVFVLQTACNVRMQHQSELVFAAVDVPVPTTLGVMQIRPLDGVDKFTLDFLDNLNFAFHNQL